MVQRYEDFINDKIGADLYHLLRQKKVEFGKLA
ncbi:hypothetical protein HNP69_001639 [Chryseobacterium koreense]|nr:hypothetical protein [Chryseobacterium koreense]